MGSKNRNIMLYKFKVVSENFSTLTVFSKNLRHKPSNSASTKSETTVPASATTESAECYLTEPSGMFGT